MGGMRRVSVKRQCVEARERYESRRDRRPEQVWVKADGVQLADAKGTYGATAVHVRTK